MKKKTKAWSLDVGLDGPCELSGDLGESPWEIVSFCEGVGTPSLDRKLILHVYPKSNIQVLSIKKKNKAIHKSV